MSLFFFLPWLLVLIPVFYNEPVDWYKDHSFLQTDTALDIGVIMPRDAMGSCLSGRVFLSVLMGRGPKMRLVSFTLPIKCLNAYVFYIFSLSKGVK